MQLLAKFKKFWFVVKSKKKWILPFESDEKKTWRSSILDIFLSVYFHKRNVYRQVVTAHMRLCISTKFVTENPVLKLHLAWIIWVSSSLILLIVCETVRSQRIMMLTRVKVIAEEEIHRGVYGKCTKKNNVYAANRIISGELYFCIQQMLISLALGS